MNSYLNSASVLCCCRLPFYTAPAARRGGLFKPEEVVFSDRVLHRIMNVYVYQAPIGRVMIDTGYENGLKKVEKKLASFNVPMAEIKYVFNP